MAPINLPPFDNSAVDGYAVRHADLDTHARDQAGGGRSGDGRPCGPPRVVARRGGAHLHRRADAERGRYGLHAGGCSGDEQSVVVPTGLKRGANRRLAGEDVRAGSVVLPAGRRLAPQHIGLAAGVGLTRLTVRRQVRVAVFSTGDEIVEPGTERPVAALFDANRYLLAGLLDRLGAESTDLGILPDDPGELARAIASAAAGHDLVLTSGGVSTGEADHVRGAVEATGSLVFWRVGIKPGRPVAMGVVRGGDGEERGVCRPAGQSGGGVRDVCAGGAAAAAASRRGRDAAAGGVAGPGRVRLPQEDRPPGIRPGPAAARRPTAALKPSSTPRTAPASSRR